jgi:hypothetical protein
MNCTITWHALGVICVTMTGLMYGVVFIGMGAQALLKNEDLKDYPRALHSTTPDEAESFFNWIDGHIGAWVGFHIPSTITCLALLLLPTLFRSCLPGNDPLALAAVMAGAAGAVFMFLANLLDLLGTPVLVEVALHGAEQERYTAWLIWRYVESWREFGLKSASLILVGLWLLWLWGAMRVEDARLAYASLAAGGVLVVAGITQALGVPWLGQRGVVSQLGWGISVTVWSVFSVLWFL